MTRLTIRGMTPGMLILTFILSSIHIGFAVISLFLLRNSDDSVSPAFNIILLIIVLVFFLLPVSFFLVSTLISYMKRVEIVDNRVIFRHPFKKKKEYCVDDISFWGCAAFFPRSTVIYFCTLDADTLIHNLESHQDICVRALGEAATTTLKENREGILRLAVGTALYQHMFRPGKDFFVLDIGNEKRIKSVCNAMQKDGLVTGSWLMNTLSYWDTLTKYQAGAQTNY